MVDARDAAEDLLLCFADDQNMYHDHHACIDIVISGVVQGVKGTLDHALQGLTGTL